MALSLIQPSTNIETLLMSPALFGLINMHRSALVSKSTASWDHHSGRPAAERDGVHHLVSTGNAST